MWQLVADAGVAADITIRADLAVRADDHVSLDEDAGQDAGAGAEMEHAFDDGGRMDLALDGVFGERRRRIVRWRGAGPMDSG